MAFSTDLWSHIYSFTEKPASAALVSKAHRRAAYRALYAQLHELSVTPFFREIGKDLGKWQHDDPDGSIQRWLAARERAITSIQLRQPRLADEVWLGIEIDPFHPFHWQLQDIRRAADALEKHRESQVVAFFEGKMREAGFEPLLHLPNHLSSQEKAATIRGWIETNVADATFNFQGLDDFGFPPCELALKLHPDRIKDFFDAACHRKDYEFLQAILTTPSCLEILATRNNLVDTFSVLYDQHPLIGKELLNNPSLEAHLQPVRSITIEIAVREGHLSTLQSLDATELNESAILERACYAGQAEIVKELLQNHHFSNAALGWNLFVTVEGPAVLVYLLPTPFISLFIPPPLHLAAYYLACTVSVVGSNWICHRLSSSQHRPFTLLEDPAPSQSPFQRSLRRSSPALVYLSAMGVSIVALAESVKFDPEDPLLTKTSHVVLWLGISVFSGICFTSLMGAILHAKLPKRSFSVWSGLYSAFRDTAVGRLKVIRDVGSALLKRIPCLRLWGKKDEKPVLRNLSE